MQADGSLDDEDLEHLHAVVDPGRHTETYSTGAANNGHTNQVFELGPDDGPETRVYAGIDEGLVLFHNELLRILLTGQEVGRMHAAGNAVVADTQNFEETVG